MSHEYGILQVKKKRHRNQGHHHIADPPKDEPVSGKELQDPRFRKNPNSDNNRKKSQIEKPVIRKVRQGEGEES